MSQIDANAIIRAYLASGAGLTAGLVALVADKIFCPSQIPNNTIMPALGFQTRGGSGTPYIPDIPMPSMQFDCWADDPIAARNVYLKLHDALQGIQNVPVVIGANTYYILSAREEVEGQDLLDVDIPGRWRVLTFYEIKVK